MKTMTTTLLATAALGTAAFSAPLAMASAPASGPTATLSAPSGLATAAPSSAASAANGALGQAFTTSTAERQGKNPKALLGGETKATGKPVAVYLLNPAFVKNGTGPVGTFAYAATSYLINGTPATVDSINKHGTWKAANIATGQDEQTYAAQAKGAPLLYEPQVHAWYAVNGATLTALNSSAKKAVGATTISVAEYAQQVHAKYAAFLPGSSYDKGGKAGGFSDAPVATSSSATSGRDTTMRTGGLAAVAGVALVGGGMALKRRRS